MSISISSPPWVACRIMIDPTADKHALPLPAARIELTNVSETVLQIECPSHPLEHLTLVVRTEGGKVISQKKYGNLLIRARREALPPLTLGPGESRAYSVSLLAAFPDEERRPGVYMVQAVYEYQSLSAESALLAVEFCELASR